MAIKGLDELLNKLADVSLSAEELDGTHEISILDLLTPTFLSDYSEFESAEQLFEEGGVTLTSQESFNALDTNEGWNDFIRSRTTFGDWNDMLQTAAVVYSKGKLGL
jgi:hypothetical protein